MAWVPWVLIGVALFALAWLVGVVLKFNRLQMEQRDQDAEDRRALRALLVRLYREALDRGDAQAARGVLMQGLAMGIDVQKEAAWSRAS